MTLATACPKPTREPKERKRITRQSKTGRLEHRAELECSALAWKRARGYCEFCFRSGVETVHALGKGSWPAIRYDGRNLVWSCKACHRRGEQDKDWLAAQMVRILGEQSFRSLLNAGLKTVKGPDPRAVIAAAKAGRFLVERSA